MLLASLREALTPLPRSLMLALDLLEKGWIWAEGQAGEAVSAPALFFFFFRKQNMGQSFHKYFLHSPFLLCLPPGPPSLSVCCPHL